MKIWKWEIPQQWKRSRMLYYTTVATQSVRLVQLTAPFFRVSGMDARLVQHEPDHFTWLANLTLFPSSSNHCPSISHEDEEFSSCVQLSFWFWAHGVEVKRPPYIHPKKNKKKIPGDPHFMHSKEEGLVTTPLDCYCSWLKHSHLMTIRNTVINPSACPNKSIVLECWSSSLLVIDWVNWNELSVYWKSSNYILCTRSSASAY